MDTETSKHLLSSLSHFLQTVCSGFVEFDSCILLTGHLYFSVDSKLFTDFVINEELSKTDDLKVVSSSKSFPLSSSSKDLIKVKSEDSFEGDQDDCSVSFTTVNGNSNNGFESTSTFAEKVSLNLSRKAITAHCNSGNTDSPSKHNTSGQKDHEEGLDYMNDDSDGDTPNKPTSQSGFTCPICSKTLSTRGSYNSHMKDHGDRPHTCGVCGKAFSRTWHLQRHLVTHTGLPSFDTPALAHSCITCGKSFMCRWDLQRHQRIHLEDKPFSCDQCGAGYAVKADLTVHYRKHTGERPFRCSECNKRYADPSVLRRHLKQVHDPTKVKIKKEEVESKDLLSLSSSFLTKNNSKDGQEGFASAEGGGKKRSSSKKGAGGHKRHICGSCGKGFMQKCDLVCHERVHTGEKPYICEMCGKSFANKNNMIGHCRIHTGEKPFPCTVCGRRFALGTALKKHTLTHTGEKPYMCEVCGHNFRTQSCRTRHRRRMHGHSKKTNPYNNYETTEKGRPITANSNVAIPVKTGNTEDPNVVPVEIESISDQFQPVGILHGVFSLGQS